MNVSKWAGCTTHLYRISQERPKRSPKEENEAVQSRDVGEGGSGIGEGVEGTIRRVFGEL